MNNFSKPAVATAVSMALALWAHEAAFAQGTPAPQPEAAKPEEAKPAARKPATPVQELETVLVIGTRQSQQSSINRKKNSATAQDSIVAEDVGAFPDRNIGEAISRIAGVALERGDFGEGVNVSIRGNGPELTRVELDGMGVRSGAGTDLLGGGDGRGTEFRELPSDLIKSVDVIKGSTAAMTEGSLGGGILITTRTGLDFDKPYYMIKAEATQSDLIKKATPRFNVILADKFLDNKLGVLLNWSKSRVRSEMHSISQGGSSNSQGLVRMADFDNSPEKTFTHNPNTLSKTDPTSTATLLASPKTTAAGGGFFNAATPLEVLTRSAAAQSKADCFTAFPNLTSAEIASIVPGTRNATINAAINQRNLEQMSCLNQWNDYTPSHTAGFRYNLRGQDDQRDSADIRFDFKVNDKLTVYTKLAAAKRHVDDTVGFLGVGSNMTFNSAFTDTFRNDGSAAIRSLTPGVSGSLLATTYSLPSATANNGVTRPLSVGATTSILPGYKVDASHHVTSYSVDNGTYGTDTIFSTIDTDSKTLITGGEYKDGRLKAQLLAGTTKSTAMRYDRRASFGYAYGIGDFAIQPNGIWAFTLPNGSQNDQLNFPKYATLNPAVASNQFAASAVNPVTVPAYTAAQRAQYTNNTQLLVIRSFDTDTSEKTAKLDLSYDLVDKVPFLTSLKGGVNFRKNSGNFWSGAGGTVKEPVSTFGQAGFVPGVYMTPVNTRWNVIGCENTSGSLAAGGQPCAQNGYVPNNQLNSGIGAVVAGTTTLTRAQYEELVRQTMTIQPAGQYYQGAKDRPSSLINGWNQIDIDKLFAMAGVPVRLDCFRQCTASDGKVYDMPVSRYSEKTTAAYVMTDFEVDRVPFTSWSLPFGMELAGNIGVRVVKTDVEGTGYMTFRSLRINPATFNPANPNDPAGLISYQQSMNTSIKDSATDVLPSLNLVLWPVADKLALRYSVGKTVARPPVSKLLPEGTCTIAEFTESAAPEDDGTPSDQACGRFGNPALKPQTNVNHNLSLEWFPNRDTMFSAAIYRQRGVIGAPTLLSPRTDAKPFAGSAVIDPVTGKPLADMEFSFNQWDNQPAATRKGFEVGMKTAFTFLPSILRYTGFDANFTKAKSTQGQPALDLISGDVLPVVGEPKYSYNASLWYDDGGFQARVAMQVVSKRYWNFSPGTTTNVGVNNYSSIGTTSWRQPYNPGAPIFGPRTAFVDAKVSYRFKNGLEIFADARNLTGERTQTTTGGYQDYADGIPSIYNDNYNGRRYTIGMTLRSPR